MDPPKRPIPTLIHNITLNLNTSTSRQNIKNLVVNFGGIYVRIMRAKFQASSFNGVGREWYGRRKEGQTIILAAIHNRISNYDNINKNQGNPCRDRGPSTIFIYHHSGQNIKLCNSNVEVFQNKHEWK